MCSVRESSSIKSYRFMSCEWRWRWRRRKSKTIIAFLPTPLSHSVEFISHSLALLEKFTFISCSVDERRWKNINFCIDLHRLRGKIHLSKIVLKLKLQMLPRASSDSINCMFHCFKGLNCSLLTNGLTFFSPLHTRKHATKGKRYIFHVSGRVLKEHNHELW